MPRRCRRLQITKHQNDLHAPPARPPLPARPAARAPPSTSVSTSPRLAVSGPSKTGVVRDLYMVITGRCVPYLPVYLTLRQAAAIT